MQGIADKSDALVWSFIPKTDNVIELKRELVGGELKITHTTHKRNETENNTYLAHNVFGKDFVEEIKTMPSGSSLVMTILRRFVTGDKIAELLVPIMKIRNLKNIMNEYHLITGEIR